MLLVAALAALAACGAPVPAAEPGAHLQATAVAEDEVSIEVPELI